MTVIKCMLNLIGFGTEDGACIHCMRIDSAFLYALVDNHKKLTPVR